MGSLPHLAEERLVEQKEVETDDQRGDSYCGGSRQGAIDEVAHQVAAAREEHQGHQRERDAEGEDDLAEDQGTGGVDAEGDDDQRREHGDQTTQPDRDLPVDEALHYHLSGHGADGGGRETGGKQRDGEDDAGSPTKEWSESAERLEDDVALGGDIHASLPESCRRHHQHRGIDQTGDPHGDQDIDQFVTEDAPLLLGCTSHDAVLGQGRVEIDDVWHDGGAEDAGRQEYGLRAGKAGMEHGLPRGGEVRPAQDRLDQVAEADDADKGGDDRLQEAEAVALQGEDGEGDDRGQDRGWEERDPEQQIEPDGRAEELREVGGHGDDFGQQPERPGQGAGELLPDHLRQAQPGGDTELRGERLHQHRHQVGGEDDPEQQIAILGTGLDVGGEVAGIHVGDRGDERRTEKRQQTPQSATARGAFQNGRGVLLGRLARIARCGGDGGEGRVSGSVFTSGHENRLRKDTWFIPDRLSTPTH